MLDIFLVLSDPTRRHIIEMLAAKHALSATDISSRFHTSPAAISQHLKALKDADILHVEKAGQHRMYSLNPGAFHELEQWIQMVKSHMANNI